jgi:hypothetical protein
VGCTERSAAASADLSSRLDFPQTETARRAGTDGGGVAEYHAGAVAEPDPINWTTYVVGAAAATALAGRLLGAGLAIRYTRRLALPPHALLSLCTAVEAFAIVALICLEVYAPVLAATLAFRAGASLIISPPNAVLRAALGVPPTCPSQAPAIVAQATPARRPRQLLGGRHPSTLEPCPLRGRLLQVLWQARLRNFESFVWPSAAPSQI